MIDDQIKPEDNICRDYIHWKKNVPFLYDTVMTHDLTWPSLTVQWLPDITRVEDRDYSTQRVILGTQSELEQNHLIIATVTVPNNYKTFEAKHYDAEKDEFGGYGLVASQVDVTIRINHDGCINRARSLPQCENVIATKTSTGDVLLFDYTRHPSKPDSSGKCKPEMVLKGHTMEGFGLSWCTKQAGLLLSSSSDGSIHLWDINNNVDDAGEGKFLRSYSEYLGHKGSVEDVCWHKFSTQLFASVGIDRQLFIWDRRQSQPVVRVQAHDDECICVDSSPFSEHLMATGSEDGTVGLWDLRSMNSSVKYLYGHTGAVTQVQWSPHREALLASSSNDRKVHIWDLTRKQQSDDNTDISHSPELGFIHVGHCSKVVDFSWNANMALMLASVSYDNILQIWQPSEI